jgi:hypothetical protein
MFKNIPLSRAILYLLCLGLLPFLFVVFLFISQKNDLKDLQENLETIEHLAFMKEKKQALNMAVHQHFRDADHFYIDKYLETLVFLEPEIEQLQKIVEDKNFSDDDRVKKRLEFLTTDANALVFSEGIVQTFPLFQETAETLVHSVEVDSKDIQKILARVEGMKIGEFTPGTHRPQLVVTEFKLDKKKVNDKNEVYLLDLKLIKREFL